MGFVFKVMPDVDFYVEYINAADDISWCGTRKQALQRFNADRLDRVDATGTSVYVEDGQTEPYGAFGQDIFIRFEHHPLYVTGFVAREDLHAYARALEDGHAEFAASLITESVETE